MDLPTVEQLGQMNAEQLKALIAKFEAEAANLNRSITVAETERRHHEAQMDQLRARIKEICGDDEPNHVRQFIADRQSEAEQALKQLHSLYNPQPQPAPVLPGPGPTAPVVQLVDSL